MILATGRINWSSRRQDGFTLIEIILVVALIALGSGVLIMNFNAFANREDSTSPEEVIREAIREARFQAAADRVVTKLSYDEDSGTLQLTPSGKSFEINSNFGPEGSGNVRFLLIPPAKGLSSFPEPGSATLETAEVAFAPDRSSTPFIAEIDNGQTSPFRLYFDPFSDIVRTGE